jgi:polyisoprenoid-binding protein YceI
MILRPLLVSLLLPSLLVAAVAAPALAATYTIDPRHSQARFTYSHLGFSNITGIFTGIEGELVHDPANPTASAVQVRIPIASVLTGVEKLDQHLQADDFFDAAAHPLATFTSTAVEDRGDGKLAVTGDLVIRGETRSVVLDVSLNGMGPHPMRKVPAIGFDGRTTLLRSDFGIDKNTPLVGDEVRIEVTVEAMQLAD